MFYFSLEFYEITCFLVNISYICLGQSCVDAQFFNECLGVDIINQSGRIFYEGPENTFQACNWTFVWPETYLEQVVFVLLLIVFNPDEGQNNAVILPDGESALIVHLGSSSSS